MYASLPADHEKKFSLLNSSSGDFVWYLSNSVVVTSSVVLVLSWEDTNNISLEHRKVLSFFFLISAIQWPCSSSLKEPVYSCSLVLLDGDALLLYQESVQTRVIAGASGRWWDCLLNSSALPSLHSSREQGAGGKRELIVMSHVIKT